jgi:glycosyltransferase involved in cell wall biosynthesis
MKVECHILSFNEAEILPYTLRHYATFCQKIVLHDAMSTDGTRHIAKGFGCEIRDWIDPDGKFDDRTSQDIKNTAWRRNVVSYDGQMVGLGGEGPAAPTMCADNDVDWVIVADADELIYFPTLEPRIALSQYLERATAVVKPYGYELVSDKFPTTAGQIYDEVKMGGRDDLWYAKPILFTPRLVRDIYFAPGAHQAHAILNDGTSYPNPTVHSVPDCYLLHCKHLGPVERIARLYDEKRSRLSAYNWAHGQGNFRDGMIHAQDKRNQILSRLERVIA